jgi:hypothetical protein
MHSAEVYRQRASDCQRMAASVETEALRASWLAMADGWMRLAAWKDHREKNAFGPEMKDQEQLSA